MKLYFSLVLNLWPRVLLEFPLGCFLKHLAANRWKMSPFLSPFLPLSVLFTASWPGRLLLGLLISQTPEQSLAWLVRGGYCLTPLHPDRALKRQSSNLPAKAASLPAACSPHQMVLLVLSEPVKAVAARHSICKLSVPCGQWVASLESLTVQGTPPGYF